MMNLSVLYSAQSSGAKVPHWQGSLVSDQGLSAANTQNKSRPKAAFYAS
ncbi:hypothetical protein BLL52_3784 [Rhodoferax antarcticus ANT.BR]|uniref:Uncharacterized protein n=1 Tax=Rhodoferax antarcticus ANT.BR TaxID=1111071 RepID=A0A1Q8YAA9_9BURK|nr:hypothetical protein BLL52_3784 [Rhodoferax antarcticus ANT.BR]